MYYAEIILPLALPRNTYTYSVPDDLVSQLMVGQRVEVPFGKSKLYSGVVERIHQDPPGYMVKSILCILEELVLISEKQLQLWDWIARYYACTLGEVMSAALPGNMKLTSETRLVVRPEFGDDFSELNAEEYLIAEALQLQQEITIEDARKILQKKTVLPIIQRLLYRGVLQLREDLREKYSAKKVMAVRWGPLYRADPSQIAAAYELATSAAQQRLLTGFIQLNRGKPYVTRKELLRVAEVSDSPLNSLQKLEILEVFEREVSRTADYQNELSNSGSLSDAQKETLRSIHRQFTAGKQVVLLHGVTGSGKTQLYMELMRETLLQGGQAMYLLPEIALTTQVVQRLTKVFGGDIRVYHSRISANERVDVWKEIAQGKPLLLGARSALFLPFQDLKLIIIDEEHDPSFKQHDPAPRYNARDAAIYLAQLTGAKVLLGSATPSLESYFNSQTGKFGYATLTERFGGLQLPQMEVIDLREQQKKKQVHGIFSVPLIDGIRAALSAGEQVILFQNRRGYAPVLECTTCGWSQMCKNCDVTLTYHKHQHKLRCHYCNFHLPVPETCSACGSGKLSMVGFGTEKIEDELKVYLPEARVARMDLDTAGSKSGLANLLSDFEEKEIDVLVGTQMVTKGLDFENVGLVGVLSADQLVRYPDFRNGERAFQLLTQVAGRAGRKNKQGKVLIQAYAVGHPVIKEVLENSFNQFVERELKERKEFNYPPYFRLIQLTVLHKDDKITAAAAAWLAANIRSKLGPDRVLGPVLPATARLRNLYQQHILLKLEKNIQLIQDAKGLIQFLEQQLVGKSGWAQVRIVIDVDPI